jgi:hypothetical protein
VWCRQRLARFADFLENLLDGGGPDKGYWVRVALIGVRCDGGDPWGDARHSKATDLTLRKLTEEALDEIEPPCGGRRVKFLAIAQSRRQFGR